MLSARLGEREEEEEEGEAEEEREGEEEESFIARGGGGEGGESFNKTSQRFYLSGKRRFWSSPQHFAASADVPSIPAGAAALGRAACPPSLLVLLLGRGSAGADAVCSPLDPSPPPRPRLAGECGAVCALPGSSLSSAARALARLYQCIPLPLES